MATNNEGFEMTIREKLDKKGDILQNNDLIDLGLFKTMNSLYASIYTGGTPKFFKVGATTCYKKSDVFEYIEKLENHLPTGGMLPYAIRSGAVINKGHSLPVTRAPYVKSGKYSKKDKQAQLFPKGPQSHGNHEHPHMPEFNSKPLIVNVGNLLNQQFDSMNQSLETIKQEWRLDHDLLNAVRKDMLELQEENKALNQRCTELHDRLQHLENDLGVTRGTSLFSRVTNKLRGFTQ